MTQWLHYVGAKLYDPARFSAEAAKYDVQRAVPFSTLMAMEYGDTVLTAVFEQPDVANVFGYFIVDGISTNMPSALFNMLLKRLDVVDFKPCSQFVRRGCGSYTLAASVVVRDSLHGLVCKIADFCAEVQMKPDSFKWFVTGQFTMLENPVRLQPKKRHRGYERVQVDLKLEPAEESETVKIDWIIDYKRRRYLNRKDRAALEAALLQECATA